MAFDPNTFSQQFQQHLNEYGVELSHGSVRLGNRTFPSLVPHFASAHGRGSLGLTIPNEMGSHTNVHLTRPHNTSVPSYGLSNIVNYGRDQGVWEVWEDYQGPEHLAERISRAQERVHSNTKAGKWKLDDYARKNSERDLKEFAASNPMYPYQGHWLDQGSRRNNLDVVKGRFDRNFQFRQGLYRYYITE